MRWFTKIPFLNEQVYERYLPSAFDESLTLLQKVNKVIEGLNQVISAVNNTFEVVDGQNDAIQTIRDDFEILKTWLESEGLQERTVWVLNEWFDSGRLAQIINNDVFDMKADKTTFEQFVLSTTTQLQQIEQDFTTQLQQTEQDLTTQLHQNVVTTDLHITMHFNYTDPIEIQENIDNLKKLGYNTVIIQRTSNPMLNDVTGVETKKLIKQFKENNVNLILHVDYETLLSSNYQPVANWINAIDDTNIVGYWYADEPFVLRKPKEDLMLAYNRLKIITDKPIFVTDPCYNSNFYVKCFDVLIWNIYLNAPIFRNANPSQRKFSLLYEFVDHFYNQPNPPKTVIPMYPTFSKWLDDGAIDFSIPTMAETQTMIDFYKNTGIASNNISTFMYHYRDTSPFDDLYNNDYLKYLSHYILQNGKTPNQQDIHYLNRSNYATSSALVSTNMVPSAEYDSLVLSNGTAGEIILRVTKKGNYVNNELFFRCEVHNNGDGAGKNIEVAISYDGSTYVQSASKNFTAGGNAFPLPTDPVVSLNVQNMERSFFVRFRLKNTDDTPMESGVYPSVGIKNLYVGLL